MTSTSITPPVRLARRARHRKPNRRRGVIRAALGSFVIVAAVLASLTGAAAAHRGPAFYGITPGQLSQAATALETPGVMLTADVTGTYAQDGAACSAVYHFHHVDATARLYADEGLWQGAYRHAWHAAMSADPFERRDIHAYLSTGRGWPLVRLDCVADDWAAQ
jgi:hypothetical protein